MWPEALKSLNCLQSWQLCYINTKSLNRDTVWAVWQCMFAIKISFYTSVSSFINPIYTSVNCADNILVTRLQFPSQKNESPLEISFESNKLKHFEQLWLRPLLWLWQIVKCYQSLCCWSRSDNLFLGLKFGKERKCFRI